MRQLDRVICCAAALLTLAACGTQGASPGMSTSASPGASSPSAFPLTITRTGGIAGFQDVLVVAGSGLVSVTHKGQAPRQCQLTPEAAERLRTAAALIQWPHITPAAKTASHPDDMVTLAVSPAGGPVRLEDPSLGAAGPVLIELVNDLNGGRSASGMCTPV